MPLPFGPRITHFGIANADGHVPTPIGTAAPNVPIYTRISHFGFLLVVEGAPGTSRSNVGQRLFNSDETDPTVRPDLQILVAVPLGDGSPAVCDEGGLPGPTPDATPNLTPVPGGGVPARPLTFDSSQETANAMNDLSCRFDVHDSADRACTLDDSGNFAFAGGGTTVQFCGLANRVLSFPTGDTWVSVQLVDVAHHIGERRTIVIRVQ